MRHVQRHLLLLLVFVAWGLWGALFTPEDSPFRAGVARDDETYELTMEAWNLAKREQRLQRDKETRKGFALYYHAPLPSFSDVVDDRTLLSPEYLGAQNLLMLPGPVRAAAESDAAEKLLRDRQIRRLHENMTHMWEEIPALRAVDAVSAAVHGTEQANTTEAEAVLSGREGGGDFDEGAPSADGRGAYFAGDEIDFAVRKMRRRLRWASEGKREPDALAGDDEDEEEEDEEDEEEEEEEGAARASSGDTADARLLPLRLQGTYLETDSVQHVDPLPSDVARTNHTAGDITRIDPKHFYAVNEKVLRRQEKKAPNGRLQFYMLPRYRPLAKPRYAWRKFYIAVNLHKNVELIPYFTGALVAFLEDEIAPFFDLATSVVVAIYANASPDLTGPLIRSFVIPYLQRAGVEHVYATVKGSCGGYLRRLDRLQERIEWMACLRNKALEPLQELGRYAFFPEEVAEVDEDASLRFHLPRGGAVRRGNASFADDDELVVLFLNDVFFHPRDLTRLLESVPEPTMAARAMPDGATAMANNDDDGGGAPRGAGRGTTFDMACGMDYYYSFYDTWVSRDRLGNPFLPTMPYTDDRETRDAFLRILSLDSSAEAAGGRRTPSHAIPVKCCWNGVAALRGSFFLPPVEPPPQRTRRPSDRSGAGHTAVGAGPRAFPPVLTRPSGARYHRVGPLADGAEAAAAGMRDALTRQYAQLLALRLAAVRAEWRRFHSLAAGKYRVTHPGAAAAFAGHGDNESAAALLRLVASELPSVSPQGATSAAGAGDGNGAAGVVQAAFGGADFFSYVPIHWGRLVKRLLPQSAALADDGGGGGGSGGGEEERQFLGRTLQQWGQLLKARQRTADPPAPFSPSKSFSEPGNWFVKDDGVLYRAHSPVVRFRHSFTPSYGAFAAAAAAASSSSSSSSSSSLSPSSVPSAAASAEREGGDASPQPGGASAPVSRLLFPHVQSNVCQASECLLICQDIMHAALLRRGRVPVILMNPRARVAYEAPHFFRVLSPLSRAEQQQRQCRGGEAAGATEDSQAAFSWVYSSPRFFQLCALARDLERQRSRVAASLSFLLPSSLWRRRRAEEEEDDGVDLSLRATLSVTSAADDWTSGQGGLTLKVRHAMMPGAAGVAESTHTEGRRERKGEPLPVPSDEVDDVWVRLNVTQHTAAKCFLPTAKRVTAATAPLVDLLLLSVAGLLLWCLARWTDKLVEGKVTSLQQRYGGGAREEARLLNSGELLPEERLWLAASRAVKRWCGVCVRVRRRGDRANKSKEKLKGKHSPPSLRRRRIQQLCRRVGSLCAAYLARRQERPLPPPSTPGESPLDHHLVESDSAATLSTGESIAVSISHRPRSRSPGLPSTSTEVAVERAARYQRVVARRERLRFRDPSPPPSTGSKIV